MPETRPIQMPAGYATATAVGFADASGEMVLISADNPLPIAAGGPSVSPPHALTGQANSSLTAGPFVPVAERPIVIQLDGTWEGAVQLLRSVDGGATKQTVTLAGEPWGRFSGNVVEPVWQEHEAGVELYLDVSIESGTVDYRVSQ